MKRIFVALPLAASFLLTGASLPAQEKDMTVEGQIKIGVHKLKLEAGTLYQFEVKGKGFSPNVVLPNAFLHNTADIFKDRNTYRALYMPGKSAEVSLMISPNLFSSESLEGTLDYTFSLKAMKLEEKPALKKEEKITSDDPRYNQNFRKTHYKAYTFKMTKGKTYVIDMVKTGGGDNKLDPYLILENPMKQIAAQDDDSGGFPNARIVYRPIADGEYRIVATGLSDFSGMGDFTLTVRTVKDEK
jgi:hypothetical protein